MIFVGYRTKKNGPIPTGDLYCPSCGDRSLFLYAFHKYAHVYWIPMFPFSKTIVLHCGSCDTAWDMKDAQGELGAAASSMQSELAAPWYLYVGLMILGVIILVSAIT